MRPHRRWLFIVVSHTLCKDRFHACHEINPYFINHETCQIRVNLNSLEINHDHFPSMSSPNFRLSGGSLGYWTPCNNFKRHCTLPYCDKGVDFVDFMSDIAIYINTMSIYVHMTELLFALITAFLYFLLSAVMLLSICHIFFLRNSCKPDMVLVSIFVE